MYISNIFKSRSNISQIVPPYEADLKLQVPIILWHGGYVWKVPFNGRGAPSRRVILIKREKSNQKVSRPVEVVDFDGKIVRSADEEYYVAFPYSLVVYHLNNNCSAPVGKDAKQLILEDGSYVVEGHSTPAFWKLSNRNGAVPPKHVCFSVVTHTRTLDLAVESVQEMQWWMEAFRALGLSVKNATDIKSMFLRTNSNKGIEFRVAETSNRQGDIRGVIIPSPRKHSVSSTAPARVTTPSAPTKDDFQLHRLLSACHTGAYSEVETLLRNGLDVNSEEPRTRDTPLMVAAREGHSQIASLCLHFGAKNDPHPDFGQTALHAAVEAGQLDVANVILNAAAKLSADSKIVNLTDNAGKFLLHTAVQHDNLPLIQLLISHGADIYGMEAGATVLHVAAYHGSQQSIVSLLDQGADSLIDAVDADGNTPLHYAALNGHLYCAKTLLETAADARYFNNHGKTARDFAVSRNHPAIVSLIDKYTIDALSLSSTLRSSSSHIAPGDSVFQTVRKKSDLVFHTENPWVASNRNINEVNNAYDLHTSSTSHPKYDTVQGWVAQDKISDSSPISETSVAATSNEGGPSNLGVLVHDPDSTSFTARTEQEVNSFECCGVFWMMGETADGFRYYWTSSVARGSSAGFCGDHSQWEDPREFGVIKMKNLFSDSTAVMNAEPTRSDKKVYHRHCNHNLQRRNIDKGFRSPKIQHKPGYVQNSINWDDLSSRSSDSESEHSRSSSDDDYNNLYNTTEGYSNKSIVSQPRNIRKYVWRGAAAYSPPPKVPYFSDALRSYRDRMKQKLMRSENKPDSGVNLSQLLMRHTSTSIQFVPDTVLWEPTQNIETSTQYMNAISENTSRGVSAKSISKKSLFGNNK